ncbi:MAG TPA: DUF4287 domain-containing protein [Candidatus Limnocylindrales bacterium]|nr:DUF4287 domain-containing protein [Candidatus Limnocylindrales bacterium]
MTTQKLFKRRVRERMSKTGESYAAARRHVGVQRERIEAARIDLSPAFDLASDAKVRKATGQGWADWLSLLDEWGARGRRHGETVEFLIAEHGVPGWYAQAITNGYERTRGIRAKHQQPEGFTVYASRTVGVPLAELFSAVTDARKRRKWLTDGSMTLRSSQDGKVARFTWADGPTRILATFEDKGPSKSTAYVAHERLPDADEAEAVKAGWKLRLAALKSFLETTGPSA